jgi:hypothetical protein
VSGWRPGKERLLKASRHLARVGVLRTPDARTSENSPSTHPVNRGLEEKAEDRGLCYALLLRKQWSSQVLPLSLLAL